MVANSTVILPLLRPISTLTRVSKQIRQPVGEVAQRGGDRLGCGWAPGRLFRFVGAEGDDLLDRADRESLGDDPLRQALLRERRVEREKSAGMAGADHAGGDALLHRGRQVEQAESVADVRAGAADPLGELFVSRAEVVEQLLVRRRLFEGIELRAVKVLDERVAEHVVVGRLADDGRDAVKPGSLRCPHPPLAHDELVAVGAELPHDDRLEQADLGDGGG